MFLIVLVLVAVALALRRGRLDRLAGVDLRLGWVPIGAFVLQVALVNFPHVSLGLAARTGPAIIIGTHSAVILFVVANIAKPGAKLALLGAALNLTVMAANGGYMPVTVTALERSGHLDRRVVRENGVYVAGSKDVVLADPEIRLASLADIFSIPNPLPLAATFSLGDVFLVLGVSTFVYKTISGPRQGAGAESPGEGANTGWGWGFPGKGRFLEGRKHGHGKSAVAHWAGIDGPRFPRAPASEPGGGHQGAPIHRF